LWHRRQDLAAQPRPQAGAEALHLVSASPHPPTSAGSTGDRGKIQRNHRIPALVERITSPGALVSIDARDAIRTIAQGILDAKADYLLAVKDNQPTSCRN